MNTGVGSGLAPHFTDLGLHMMLENLRTFFSSWVMSAGEAHSRVVQARQWLQPGHNWAGVERLSMCISGGSTAVSWGG